MNLPLLHKLVIKTNLRVFLYTLSFLVIGLSVSACGAGTVQPTPTKATTKTSIQLHWLHSVSFSPFYIATDKGYFANEGLDVGILAGGFDEKGNFIDPIERVVSGKADFGTADSTTILNARASGKPVVAIAAIYQRHPLALTSLRAKGIVKPQDLIGKTIQTTGTSKILIQALLRSQGIDPQQVKIVERKDLTEKPLLTGEADVIDAWLITEIVTLKLNKVDVNLILPGDYGIEVYPEVLFTTEDMILKHPDVVNHFLRATLNGIQTAVDNSQYAAQLSQKYDKEHSPENITLAMDQSLPLLLPATRKPGFMDAKVWQYIYTMLKDQNLLDSSLAIEKAYTLTFLNDIYGNDAK